MKCELCGQGGHAALALHSRCHIEAPTWAWYNALHGLVSLYCSECHAPIATFDVGEPRNVAPGDPGPHHD